MTTVVQDLTEQARNLLSRTQIDFEETLALAEKLRKNESFSYARKLYGRVRQLPPARWPEKRWRHLAQQHSLVTYKDPDLPADIKFDLAYTILSEAHHLPTTTDQETLGQAGSIFKRKWEVDGQRSNLERALGYYYRGYQQGVAKDLGYTAINAAYVLELLAMQEEEAVQEDRSVSVSAILRRDQAATIRQEIIHTLSDEAKKKRTGAADCPKNNNDYWLFVTLAEAHFGLQQYDEADVWLQAAKKLPGVGLWQRQSTTEQMAAIARFHTRKAERAAQLAQEAQEAKVFAAQNYETAQRAAASCAQALQTAEAATTAAEAEVKNARQRSEQATAQAEQAKHAAEAAQQEARRVKKECIKLAKQARDARLVLKKFLDNETTLENCMIGKVGLALSGGGFRASLFHIGVLAKLADMDVLRHVEVLSCVSGGSILGAHYYLELRKLLQTTKDGELKDRSGYISIVQKLVRDFEDGVKNNLRMRIIGNVWANLKMTLSPTYSRSMRLGELYEKHLYKRVTDDEGDQNRFLNELFIEPCAEDEGFNPKRDNWKRRNKVPMLILNATSLNTGHNWQFTASFMGEPPAAINSAVDGNYRLRRMYYKNQAPEPHNTVRLGHAVAASSGVPGLLSPLTFDGLYDGKVVRLVDGGVYDNQGTASLLEQDCKVMLVSDACGQMGTLDNPGASELGVVLRAAEISQERVRHAQYREMVARRRSGALRGMMFVHLKKDLDVELVDWHGCLDPREDSTDARSPAQHRPVTSYGVHKELQRRLAAIRTDLDSFSESEAYALMASGYLMTEDDFLRNPGIITGLTPDQIRYRSSDWRFLKLEEPLREYGRQEKLASLLTTASLGAFKAWKIVPSLRFIAGALGMLGIAIPLSWFLKKELWAKVGWLDTRLLSLCLTLPTWLTSLLQRFSLLGAGTEHTYCFNLTWKWIYGAMLLFIFGRVFGQRIMAAARWRKTLSQAAFAAGASLLGWLLTWVHLLTVDKLYLRWGESNRLLKKK
jgi:predicted acylesterase/phospholipase RssA